MLRLGSLLELRVTLLPGVGLPQPGALLGYPHGTSTVGMKPPVIGGGVGKKRRGQPSQGQAGQVGMVPAGGTGRCSGQLGQRCLVLRHAGDFAGDLSSSPSPGLHLWPFVVTHVAILMHDSPGGDSATSPDAQHCCWVLRLVTISQGRVTSPLAVLSHGTWCFEVCTHPSHGV